MDASVPDPRDDTRTDASGTPPGLAFDAYRLLQKIGEGGMGEVWHAEQTRPVRRQVALKIIKAGMDTAQVVARFEAERQALALMDHPAIATVFDAGSTPEGRPYFAMEYVKGEPITAYCDRHRLGTKARLELLILVCEGVQHAHQKGIIHRDLKPSNVLVTLQDDRPVPKIIDFGVAKATTLHLTERSLFTELGVLIGTPEYMSPEQAELTGLDIDTRTDVYALGVLLYELLTGSLPFDRKDLRRAGLLEIQRVIREKEPPRPSTRITQLGSGSVEVAHNRHTEPRRLASQLRGDLDWITMKALEKDRTRRYDTVIGLANDVRRHLRNEPVVAGPPSAVYGARKFVRRHLFGVGTAAAFVLLLLAFGVTMAIQAQRIANERDRANREVETSRQISDFMMGLFSVSEPSEAVANSITAREILDRGSDKIRDQLETVPGTRAALMVTMGNVYRRLGLYERAQSLLSQALALRQRQFGTRSLEAAASLAYVGDVLESRGQSADAERLLRDALAIRREHLGDHHLEVAESMESLGYCLMSQARYDEAEKFQRGALQIRQDLLGASAIPVAHSWTAVGDVLFDRADLAGAERAFRAALAIQRTLRNRDHPEVTYCRENLAAVLIRQGRYAESEVTYRETLEALRNRLGPEHPELAMTLSNLGATLHLQRKYGEALAAYVQAESLARKGLGGAHPRVARYLRNKGQTLNAMGQYVEAERAFREALTIDRSGLGADHPSVGTDLMWLSSSLRYRRKFGEAELLSREAVKILEQKGGSDNPRAKEARGVLGLALAAKGQWAEAEPLLVAYHAALQASRDVEGDPGEVVRHLVAMYEAQRKPDKAAEWRAKLPKGGTDGR